MSGFIMLAQSAERRRRYAKDLGNDTVFRALKEGSGGAGVTAMALEYFLVLIPAWVTYLVFFLSRNRDYLADEHAALITKSPEDMIAAIERSRPRPWPRNGKGFSSTTCSSSGRCAFIVGWPVFPRAG